MSTTGHFLPHFQWTETPVPSLAATRTSTSNQQQMTDDGGKTQRLRGGGAVGVRWARPYRGTPWTTSQLAHRTSSRGCVVASAALVASSVVRSFSNPFISVGSNAVSKHVARHAARHAVAESVTVFVSPPRPPSVIAV